jgi:hypothetical protein
MRGTPNSNGDDMQIDLQKPVQFGEISRQIQTLGVDR